MRQVPELGVSTAGGTARSCALLQECYNEFFTAKVGP